MPCLHRAGEERYIYVLDGLQVHFEHQQRLTYVAPRDDETVFEYNVYKLPQEVQDEVFEIKEGD